MSDPEGRLRKPHKPHLSPSRPDGGACVQTRTLGTHRNILHDQTLRDRTASEGDSVKQRAIHHKRKSLHETSWGDCRPWRNYVASAVTIGHIGVGQCHILYVPVNRTSAQCRAA